MALGVRLVPYITSYPSRCRGISVKYSFVVMCGKALPLSLKKILYRLPLYIVSSFLFNIHSSIGIVIGMV